MIRRTLPSLMRFERAHAYRGNVSARHLMARDWRHARPKLRAIITLAAIASSAISSEDLHWQVDQPAHWADPDASHHGKHALGGVLIGAATYDVAALVTESRPRRFMAATISGAGIGLGYELIAGADGRSSVDPVDAGWVAAGALVGAAVMDITGQLFSITTRHDGVALALAWRW